MPIKKQKYRGNGPETRGALVRALLRWFEAEKREMPWRETRDPYAIWVSETMLQQTQVETVKPFYHRFLERFPTVQDLAAAELERVLEVWTGLGYYRRAKHLHAAAKMVVERFGGKVPGTVAQLLELPGVGRYTAGAVASIAFGEKAAVVDGNVVRVLARLGAVEEDVKKAQTIKRLWVMAEELVAAAPAGRVGDLNQGLMELGSLVCRKGVPRCDICPISPFCEARLHGIEQFLPRNSPRRTVAVRELVAVRVRDSRGRMLVMKRPRGGLWEEMWEVPTLEFSEKLPVSSFQSSEGEKVGERVRKKGGGLGREGKKVGDGTGVNWEGWLADKISRALSLGVAVERRWVRVRHVLTHRRLEYWVASGRCAGAAPAVKLAACGSGFYTAWRWVTDEEMHGLAMATGMKKVMGAE